MDNTIGATIATIATIVTMTTMIMGTTTEDTTIDGVGVVSWAIFCLRSDSESSDLDPVSMCYEQNKL